MPSFLVLIDNKVINTIVADSKELAEELTGALCVEAEEAGIGDAYDPETETFSTPEIIEAEVVDDEPLAIEGPVEGASMSAEEAEAFLATIAEELSV